MIDIALIAPRHHGTEGVAAEPAAWRHVERKEREKGRAFEIARHEKASWPKGRDRRAPARVEQVARKDLRARESHLFVFGCVGIEASGESEPIPGGGCA